MLCAFSIGFCSQFKGSMLTLSLGALLYITIATGMGLLISCFMKSQIAVFCTSIITLILQAIFRMIDPVSSLEGIGKWIGIFIRLLTFLLSRNVFKRTQFIDLPWSLFRYYHDPIVIGLSVFFLKSGGLCGTVQNIFNLNKRVTKFIP